MDVKVSHRLGNTPFDIFYRSFGLSWEINKRKKYWVEKVKYFFSVEMRLWICAYSTSRVLKRKTVLHREIDYDLRTEI